MVTAAGRASASDLIAGRFLRLAAEAEFRADLPLARDHFLRAVCHDATPASLLEFGRFLADCGQREDAILMLQDSWQMAKRRERPDEIAVCCRRLASMLRADGHNGQAHRFLQRAADAEMSAWTEGEASFSSEQLLMESQFAEQDGDLLRATALCEAALQASTFAHRAAVLRHRACLQMLQNRRRAAAQDLVEAARLARGVSDERVYAECLLELGRCLRSLPRLQLAIRCYRAAAVRFERAGRRRQAGVARRWLRECAAIERTAKGDPDWN
jgi:tetratricopeptide (TPR) repeat protein